MRRPMTGSASEPGIQQFEIPGLRLKNAYPGMISRETKSPGVIRGFFACAPPAPKQHHRAGDMVDPLWNLLDMTPEGRGGRGFRRWGIDVRAYATRSA